jgi:ribosomal protein S18 acetylase RimI-like enzyme
MIRPIEPADTAALVVVCEKAGVFSSDELAVLVKLFDDYHATNAKSGHQALTYDEGGTLIGVVYLTPKEMTDRTWELLMIMVDGSRQGQGVGASMLRTVEDTLRGSNGRMLLVETMSISEFERTRQFYRKNGYAEVAQVPDYYAAGVGKTTFTKLL